MDMNGPASRRRTDLKELDPHEGVVLECRAEVQHELVDAF